MSFAFENGFEFPAGGIVETELGAGAQRILMEPNAGGSSRYSEAMAFEILERCEGAGLGATENEVVYMDMMPAARTDFVADISGTLIGVGVTRAFVFESMCMRSTSYPLMRAEELLSDKLMDVRDSTMEVTDEHRWQKQIVLVFTGTSEHAAALAEAWAAIDPSLRGDTVLYTVVTSGADNQIYFEDRCAP